MKSQVRYHYCTYTGTEQGYHDNSSLSIERLDMRMRRVIFSPSKQRAGGGGGGAASFFFFFPCSADHERDWPP